MEHKPDSLKNLHSSLESYYSSLHSQMRAEDDLYERRYGALFAKYDYAVQIYQSSRPSDIVDTYRNQLRTDEPTVDFTAYGTSAEAERHATLMRNWGRWALKRERENTEIDPNLQVGFDLILRGAGCKKILVDVEKIVETPPKLSGKEKREYEVGLAKSWPYISRALDPLTVFPSPGPKRPMSYILEQQSRRVIDIWESYPDWTDPKSKGLKKADKSNPIRETVWLEYWSAPLTKGGEIVEPGWYIVEVDGERVIEKENPYGFVPYIYVYSGLGKKHADGDPLHQAVGMLRAKQGEIEAEVVLKTVLLAQAQMHVFPTILTSEDAGKVARQFSVGPGRVIHHEPGQPPIYMKPPDPNSALYGFLSQIQSDLSTLASPALFGQRPTGVDFGIHQAQLTGQALTQLRPIRGALNQVGTETLNMMGRMAHLFDIRTSIFGTGEEAEKVRMVEGKDFTHSNFSVNFEVVSAEENERLLLSGQTLRRVGDLSQQTYWEKFAKSVIDDPEEEQVRLWLERLMEQAISSGAMLSIVAQESKGLQQVQSEKEAQKGLKERIKKEGQLLPEVAQESLQSRQQQMEQAIGQPGILSQPLEQGKEAMRGV